ncbi:hypothetical protein MP638_004552 [Amoeboaphelidium occidentale]|nr:hypothetical protein MP638_004552 [Amoeboaphelidium occidentale]
MLWAVVKHPERQDNVLLATSDIEADEIIFTEQSRLNSINTTTLSRKETVSKDLNIDKDWTRLLLNWINFIINEDEHALKAFSSLSSDGVLSPVAIENDPDRLESYERDAKLLHRYVNKKCKGQNTRIPSQADILRMICILETNNHSDELDDGELWCILGITASMMEHSCLPNATVILSSDGIITLKSTAKITSGDMITITYNDKEYLPTKFRREFLLHRGFVCNCSLCSGEVYEYCRPFSCSVCTSGYVFVRGDGSLGKCETCNTESEIDPTLLRKEEELRNNQDQILEDVNKYLSFLHERLLNNDLNLSWLDANGCRVNLQTDMEPCHEIYYNFIKQVLNENGADVFNECFDVGPLASFLACVWLVSCNLRLFKRLCPDYYSEDYEHNEKWLKDTLSSSIVKISYDAECLTELNRLAL